MTQFQTDLCPCGYYGTLLWCQQCQTYECSRCYHGKTNPSQGFIKAQLQQQIHDLSYGDRSRD